MSKQTEELKLWQNIQIILIWVNGRVENKNKDLVDDLWLTLSGCCQLLVLVVDFYAAPGHLSRISLDLFFHFQQILSILLAHHRALPNNNAITAVNHETKQLNLE